MAQKTYRQRAEAELKTLRALLKEGAVPEGQQPALRLQLANVLATLEIADAILDLAEAIPGRDSERAAGPSQAG